MGSRQTFYKIIKKEIPQTGQALRPLSVGHRGSPPQPPPHTGLHQHPSTTATRPSTPIHHRHQHHNHHISGCRVWGEGNPRGEDESRCPFIGSVVRHHCVSHPRGARGRAERELVAMPEGACGLHGQGGRHHGIWTRLPSSTRQICHRVHLSEGRKRRLPGLPPHPFVGGEEEEIVRSPSCDASLLHALDLPPSQCAVWVEEVSAGFSTRRHFTLPRRYSPPPGLWVGGVGRRGEVGRGFLGRLLIRLYSEPVMAKRFFKNNYI
jgi:hypothetical protein